MRLQIEQILLIVMLSFSSVKRNSFSLMIQTLDTNSNHHGCESWFNVSGYGTTAKVLNVMIESSGFYDKP